MKKLVIKTKNFYRTTKDPLTNSNSMSQNKTFKIPGYVHSIKKCSRYLERYFAIGIILALMIGVQLNAFFTPPNIFSGDFSHHHEELLTVLGLIIMMYPSVIRIKFERLGVVLKNKKILFLSLLQNWIVGPIVMFVLAACFLFKFPEFMVGLIILGLARCISMVIIWDEMAQGDREYCAGLVVFNSIFQIVAFPFYAYIFVTLLPKIFVSINYSISVSVKEVARNLFLYLGIPITFGFITRAICLKIKSEEWYEKIFLPIVSPITPITLILTVGFIFFFKGSTLSQIPGQVLHIILPMLLYFIIMFFSSFYLAYKTKASYKQCITLGFTSASNNFELALAVCISLFGIQSKEVFAVIIGSLVEIPTLVTMIRLTAFLKNKTE